MTIKMTNYTIKKETSKLTVVHDDWQLQKVQKNISAKLFQAFYSNYVKASEVEWAINPKELYL